MQSIQTILVGIDLDPDSLALTEGSRAAMEQGLSLAAHWSAKIELLFSTHGNPAMAKMSPEAIAGRIVNDLPPGGSETPPIHIASQKPWIAMIERKATIGADLVIAGKRNQSRRADRKLGSVSSRLIAKCPGPVWVAKPGHTPTLHKVLAATDLSTVGDLAVHFGAALAALEPGELCVAHAWQVPFALQWNAEAMGAEEATGKLQSIVQAASDHIRAVPGVAELGERCTILTANASADHTILQAAERTDPELVILGVTPRRGLASRILGNTAEKILSKLDCSLLTVKPLDHAHDEEE